MNKFATVGIIAMAAMLITSCAAEKETPEGVKYKVIETGDGRVAKPGEVVVMDVSIRDAKDSAWVDTKLAGMPQLVMIRSDSFKKQEYGFMELFRLISTGDSVAMTVNARDFFERTWVQPVPPGVDPESPFTIY